MVNRQDTILFWREKVKQYNCSHFATARNGPGGLKPDRVAPDADAAFSAVFETGLRTYAFKDQSTRDRFLTYYRKLYEARPCNNPVRESHA